MFTKWHTCRDCHVTGLLRAPRHCLFVPDTCFAMRIGDEEPEEKRAEMSDTGAPPN